MEQDETGDLRSTTPRLMAFSANDLEVASELYNTINDNDTITDKEKEEVSPLPAPSSVAPWLLCPFSVCSVLSADSLILTNAMFAVLAVSTGVRP